MVTEYVRSKQATETRSSSLHSGNWRRRREEEKEEGKRERRERRREGREKRRDRERGEGEEEEEGEEERGKGERGEMGGSLCCNAGLVCVPGKLQNFVQTEREGDGRTHL